VVTPAVTAVQQLRELGVDVCCSVIALMVNTETVEQPAPQVPHKAFRHKG
jgi:hypothetical protein